MNRTPAFPGFLLRSPAKQGRKPVSPLRIGTDLVWIPEIAQSLEQFGERYLNRVFSAQEQADCSGEAPRRVASLAARFAAKEAMMKVLCPAADTALPWHSIEIVRQTDGHPEIVLHGAACILAQQWKIRHLSLSMSHEKDYASATVVALCHESGKNHESGFCVVNPHRYRHQ
ncbi:holo-ACP synthase [Undibacterium sp. SXout7W]|uniref:holo-ACP synthase n=1 Tax=Undibacterium sp. SXout7W TaxID=3413049 RepID=UPI003BEF69F0